MDADLKRRLYAVLSVRELTLKDWFTAQARELLAEHEQPSLLPKGDRRDQERKP
ncbi:hypothetical protein [Falsiroseomonas bella]|uniref:hypothetical protein n=1 Tax=Falsiroseomonas bella TaxID=2184016 RepID=UPI0018EEA1EA|nr:hypothetical protein [Falsiroseomonas bella]